MKRVSVRFLMRRRPRKLPLPPEPKPQRPLGEHWLARHERERDEYEASLQSPVKHQAESGSEK